MTHRLLPRLTTKAPKVAKAPKHDEGSLWVFGVFRAFVISRDSSGWAPGWGRRLSHWTVAAVAGAVVAAAAPPRRIVSLVPNVTEMLFAIGAGDRIVGVSSFEEYPPEVKTIARVGGLLDPNLERIFALRPDFVVVYGSQVDLQKQLERAGIETLPYRHGGVADITSLMRELGKRLGTETRAEAAAKKIESGLENIRRRVRGLERPRVLLVFGREKGTLRGIYASGGVGFLHDVVEIGGGEDVYADIKRESVQASTEQILARAPEVIIEIHGAEVLTAEAAAREAAAWSTLGSVPAVPQHRVYVLSGQELVIPGPRIVQAAERIARAIHPETISHKDH